MTPGKALRAGSTKRGRVAGGEIGHRTAQTLWLHDETYWSVIWWAHKRSMPSRQILVGDVYDEALVWFLEREAKTRYDQHLDFQLKSTAQSPGRDSPAGFSAPISGRTRSQPPIYRFMPALE